MSVDTDRVAMRCGRQLSILLLTLVNLVYPISTCKKEVQVKLAMICYVFIWCCYGTLLESNAVSTRPQASMEQKNTCLTEFN